MWSPDLSRLTINESLDRNLDSQNVRDVQRPKSLKRKLTPPVGGSSRQGRNVKARSLMKRSLSFGDSPISNDDGAVERLFAEESYIADGSRPYCLPTVPGQHRDLKSITPETLESLLDGEYDDVITTYRIIDCRYPYEYIGGHIKGAENRHTEELIGDLLYSACSNDNRRHEVIVFHCEFSSKRGPKLLRYLRKRDREINSNDYPKLNYPEIYLLEGGYKAFYQTNMNLCEPVAHVPMLHKEYKTEVLQFRSKISGVKRSWAREMKRLVPPQKLSFSIY